MSHKTQSTQYICVELINEIWGIYVLPHAVRLHGGTTDMVLHMELQFSTNNFFGETYNCMELTIYLRNKTQYIKKAWYRLQARNRKGIRVERDE